MSARYNALMDTDEPDTEIDNSQSTSDPTATQQKSTGTIPKIPKETRVPKPLTSKSSKRPPPIEIWHSLLTDIITTLASSEIIKGMHLISQKNEKVHLIKANNSETYTKIKATLENKKQEYFLFTPYEEKPKTLYSKASKATLMRATSSRTLKALT